VGYTDARMDGEMDGCCDGWLDGLGCHLDVFVCCVGGVEVLLTMLGRVGVAYLCFVFESNKSIFPFPLSDLSLFITLGTFINSFFSHSSYSSCIPRSKPHIQAPSLLTHIHFTTMFN
jgi:hypothetical protein